jgi:hypothetical protein
MKTPNVTASDVAFLTKIYIAPCDCRFHISESKVTADRLGDGSDYSVEKIGIYHIGGRWYGPVIINEPTSEDLIVEKEIEEKTKKQKLIEKFKKKEPMSEEDFELGLKFLEKSY